MSSPDLMTNDAAGHHPHRESAAGFPQTPTATAALAVATRFYSPALLNHSVRSYLWGAMYGTAHGDRLRRRAVSTSRRCFTTSA